MKPSDRGSNSLPSGSDGHTGETNTRSHEAGKNFDVTAVLRWEKKKDVGTTGAESRGERQIRERKELTNQYTRRCKTLEQRKLKENQALQEQHNMVDYMKSIKKIEVLHDQGYITDNQHTQFIQAIQKKYQMSDEYITDSAKLQEKHAIESIFIDSEYQLNSTHMTDLHRLEIEYENNSRGQYDSQRTKLQELQQKQKYAQKELITRQQTGLEYRLVYNLPTPERQFRQQLNKMEAIHNQQRNAFWQEVSNLSSYEPRAKL